MKEGEKKVAIIGGGLAGLTAGLHLAERGLRPVIFEADDKYPGGRFSGGAFVEVEGWKFRLEHGVHGIWASYRNLQTMLARHEIRPLFVPAMEEAWIYRHGDTIRRAPVGKAIRYSPLPAPLHYLNLFSKPKFLAMLDLRDWLTLPLVWGGLMWGIGVDPLAENQPLSGMTLDKLVRNWAPAVRAFMIGLSRNGLSATPEEIPLSGFISFMRFYSILRRDSWIFSYLPDDGGTSIIDPLVDKVIEQGGEIRMGNPITAVKRLEGGSKYALLGEKEKGEVRELVFDNLIIATDSQNGKKIIENSLDLSGAENFYWPRGVETAVARIWFDKEPDPGPEGGIFTGDFIVDNYFWLHRIQNRYREWHKESGGSAIEVHVYGPPEVLEAPDVVLLASIIVDVQAAFPEMRGHIIHKDLQRNSKTHTLFGVGERGKHLGVVSPWDGVYFCGDWIYDPVPAFFLERSCVTGMFAANEVLKGAGKEEWPVLRYPRPEKFAGFLEKLMRAGRERRRRKGKL